MQGAFKAGRHVTAAFLACVVFSMPCTGQAQEFDGRDSYQLAQSSYVDVISALKQSGYTVLKVERTLLGRVRILAKNHEHLREMVVSRTTGEVKRDVIVINFADFENARLDVTQPPTQDLSNAGVEHGGWVSAS